MGVGDSTSLTPGLGPNLATSDTVERTDRPIIEVRDVHKFFGSLHVLKGVSMSVNRAEVVVVIGPSGSGKSTLLRCLNRLETVDRGEVIVDGQSLSAPGINVNRVRTEIGVVFQSFNLFPHLSVLRNLTLAPMRVRKLDPQGRRDRELERCSRRSASRTRLTLVPHSSRAASSSALPSPGRCAWNPRSCYSTSRPRPSTRR